MTRTKVRAKGLSFRNDKLKVSRAVARKKPCQAVVAGAASSRRQ